MTRSSASAASAAKNSREIESKLIDVLVRPDGRPYDRNFMWNEFREGVESFVAHCHRSNADAALADLDVFVETWRQLHDRDVDHTYGLMHEVIEHLGERAIGEMYDVLLVPLFTWRYEKFDIDKSPWDEALQLLMQVCFEAARSHLFGPGRRGDMEVIEYDDRYVLRFDPCGSGGRTVRGDEIEGTPPRMEEPYNWHVSKEPFSWNHFQEGVCLYCSHCITLMEELPIDRFGYPVRVVDPPRYVPGSPGACAEVPVHDVQGSDDRAGGGLRAGRPRQEERLRLDRQRCAGPARRRYQPARVRLNEDPAPGRNGAPGRCSIGWTRGEAINRSGSRRSRRRLRR